MAAVTDSRTNESRSRHTWRRVALLLIGLLVAAALVAGCIRLVSAFLTQHDVALHLAALHKDIYELATIENAVEAAEVDVDTDRLQAVDERIGATMDAVAADLPAAESRALRAEALAYSEAVATTVGGFLAGGGETADFDDEVTEPKFNALNQRLRRLTAGADAAVHDAARSLVRGLMIVLVGVFTAGILLFVLGARSQRQEGARREAVHLGARFRAIVENLREYVLVVAPDGRVTYVSPSVEVRLDAGSTPRVDELLASLPAASRADLVRLLDDPDAVGSVQVETVDHDGGTAYLEVVASDQRGNPHVGGIVVTGRDVTSQVLFNEQLRAQALTDELTGLPNRRALNEASARVFARAARSGALIGLVLIDLDGFKGINDAMGHPVGDDLLVQVADRLAAECRAHELLVRLGGDEFAVLVEDATDAEDATTLARRLRDALGAPYTLDQHLIAVHASFGVAATDASVGFDHLLRYADVALYEAKERGRNQVVVYEPGMDSLMQTEMRLRREMATGFSSGEFTMAYQPLLDLHSGRPIGLEALMRWNSASLGPVPPVAFIPVAERSGMIVQLGFWALRTACAQLVAWQREHVVDHLTMSVNVSIAQLQEKGFVEEVTRIVQETGVAPSDLVLEVTESILAQRVAEVAEVLARVREVGVKVALDDFGSGYSSMSQLQRLPVDEIKVDKEFIQAIEAGDEGSRSMANTLFAMGHSMGLRTVAEGVENLDQLDALVGQQCDIAQGYLFARPMPPAEALEFLRTFMLPVRHAAMPVDDAVAGLDQHPGQGHPERPGEPGDVRAGPGGAAHLPAEH